MSAEITTTDLKQFYAKAHFMFMKRGALLSSKIKAKINSFNFGWILVS